jgi:hypothetical protein
MNAHDPPQYLSYPLRGKACFQLPEKDIKNLSKTGTRFALDGA